MSRRNTLEAKRERRALRALKKGKVETHIDLIEWVRMRARMSRTRAQSVILAGSLTVDSHPIGFIEVKGLREPLKIPQLRVPSDYRGRIQVVTPEELRDEPVS